MDLVEAAVQPLARHLSSSGGDAGPMQCVICPAHAPMGGLRSAHRASSHSTPAHTHGQSGRCNMRHCWCVCPVSCCLWEDQSMHCSPATAPVPVVNCRSVPMAHACAAQQGAATAACCEPGGRCVSQHAAEGCRVPSGSRCMGPGVWRPMSVLLGVVLSATGIRSV
jgi:hypothetical protein